VTCTFGKNQEEGTYRELRLFDGEAVVRVDLRSGAWLDSIVFFTNRGRTIGGGGTGGSPHEVIAPSGKELVGVFGRCGTFIDQIGFIWK